MNIADYCLNLYNCDMKTRIKELRKTIKGWTQSDLAEATGLSQSYIGAIESHNIDKSPSTDTLVAIAGVLGVRIGELFCDAESIVVVGKVGAGARVPLVDSSENGEGLYSVEHPPGLPMNTNMACVEIEGENMLPVYRSGDVLFFMRDTIGVPTEAVGTICICEDMDGNAWVKYVKAGTEPGKFNLISLNPLSDNMHDIELKWASPVRLHWPHDLVKRM